MVLTHQRLITESEDLRWSYNECFIHVVLEAQLCTNVLNPIKHGFDTFQSFTFSVHPVAVYSRAPAGGMYLLNDTYGQEGDQTITIQ